ncbi:MAG: phage holin family protein [Eubacteriales bacterium]|nr:phage holin family protein [Eubacteriales bacterium]
MAEDYEGAREEGRFGITHFIIRFVVGAIVLAVTAALTPGFTISGFWPLVFSALVLAGLDYLAAKIIGVDAKAFGRGLMGFILAAVIIYVTKFFVSGYNVTIWGAVIGALIYGIVDMIIPGRAM